MRLIKLAEHVHSVWDSTGSGIVAVSIHVCLSLSNSLLLPLHFILILPILYTQQHRPACALQASGKTIHFPAFCTKFARRPSRHDNYLDVDSESPGAPTTPNGSAFNDVAVASIDLMSMWAR